MNASQGLDQHTAAWLADGPSELSDRVLDAVLREVHVTSQRPASRVPWRFPTMPALSRATGLAAVALLAVIGAGGMLSLTSDGPGHSPSPTAAPPTVGLTQVAATPRVSIDPLDTSGWTQFRSERYEYGARHPGDWELRLASGDADLSALNSLPDGRIDQLVAPCAPTCWPGPNVIGSVSFAADSQDEFIERLLEADRQARCVPLRYKWEPSVVDGVAAFAWPGCAANGSAPTFTVLAFSSGRAYFFVAYAPLDGNLFQETRELMGAFVSSVSLPG